MEKTRMGLKSRFYHLNTILVGMMVLATMLGEGEGYGGGAHHGHAQPGTIGPHHGKGSTHHQYVPHENDYAWNEKGGVWVQFDKQRNEWFARKDLGEKGNLAWNAEDKKWMRKDDNNNWSEMPPPVNQNQAQQNQNQGQGNQNQGQGNQNQGNKEPELEWNSQWNKWTFRNQRGEWVPRYKQKDKETAWIAEKNMNMIWNEKKRQWFPLGADQGDEDEVQGGQNGQGSNSQEQSSNYEPSQPDNTYQAPAPANIEPEQELQPVNPVPAKQLVPDQSFTSGDDETSFEQLSQSEQEIVELGSQEVAQDIVEGVIEAAEADEAMAEEEEAIKKAQGKASRGVFPNFAKTIVVSILVMIILKL